MEGTGRLGVNRRVRVQASVLAVIVAADGLIASAIGAPIWVALLYLGLAVAVAIVRIRLGRPAVTSAPVAAERAPARPEAPRARKAIGYVRVTNTANGDLRGQTAGITACCRERGLELVTVVHDAEGSADQQRPSLGWALEQIAERRAEVLVVARLRDLAPNVANLPPLLSWFNEEYRTLIAIDFSLDTSTEAGRLAALAVAGVGSWEHERISDRTRRGLEAARARGGGQGRTAVADIPELQERIATMREQGMTLQAIADRLNEEGVPTLRGGAMWRPSSVQRATGYRRPSAHSRGIELPRPVPRER
jgi:DNA invertase Pin-like site-specific DNA recombinase